MQQVRGSPAPLYLYSSFHAAWSFFIRWPRAAAPGENTIGGHWSGRSIRISELSAIYECTCQGTDIRHQEKYVRKRSYHFHIRSWLPVFSIRKPQTFSHFLQSECHLLSRRGLPATL